MKHRGFENWLCSRLRGFYYSDKKDGMEKYWDWAVKSDNKYRMENEKREKLITEKFP